MRPRAIRVKGLELGQLVSCDMSNEVGDRDEKIDISTVNALLEDSMILNAAHDLLDSIANKLVDVVEVTATVGESAASSCLELDEQPKRTNVP